MGVACVFYNDHAYGGDDDGHVYGGDGGGVRGDEDCDVCGASVAYLSAKISVSNAKR